jgi:hypothetical protein
MVKAGWKSLVLSGIGKTVAFFFIRRPWVCLGTLIGVAV